MTNIIKKLWRSKWKLRSLIPTIYFNFHYLPFRQAIHLPILLYKPHLKELKGEINIKGPVRHGMVILGLQGVSIYPNNGIVYENHGGSITFRGKCMIGSDSAITIGKRGRLTLGDDIMGNAAIKIIAYHDIEIADRCRLAWECTLMDTDFHSLTKADGSRTKGIGKISIGENCWLGTGCLIQKNTVLPAYTTVQARTVLCKHYDIPPRTVIGMDTKVIVKRNDIYRDLNNDHID